MTETFPLDGKDIGSIPVPHDCMIREIREEDEYLVLDFDEDSLLDDDSIQSIHPGARKLIMRFHLVWYGLDGAKAYGGILGIYQYRRKKRHEGYMPVKNLRNLIKNSKCDVSYLNHFVAYHQAILELYGNDSILLMLWADAVKFQWSIEQPNKEESQGSRIDGGSVQA